MAGENFWHVFYTVVIGGGMGISLYVTGVHLAKEFLTKRLGYKWSPPLVVLCVMWPGWLIGIPLASLILFWEWQDGLKTKIKDV